MGQGLRFWRGRHAGWCLPPALRVMTKAVWSRNPRPRRQLVGVWPGSAAGREPAPVPGPDERGVGVPV